MNRTSFIGWGIFIGAAFLFSWLLSEGNARSIYLVMSGVVLSVVVLRANEIVLPVLISLVLAMGSSYRWDLVRLSFYLRFFVLGLVALRGIFLFLEAKRSAKGLGIQRSTPLHWLYFAVSVYGIMSSIYSVDSLTTFQRSISFMLLYFVLFVYFWIQGSNPAFCEGYALSLWRALVVILGIGFLMLALRVPGLFRAGRLRLVLVNPNTLGHYCAMLVPLGIWLLFERANNQKRWRMFGILSLLFVALVWSGSRGAILTVGISLIVQFLLCYRKRLAFLLFMVALIASINAIMGEAVPKPGEDPSFVSEHLVRQGTLETGSGRTEVWKAARELIRKKPFTGYGFGIVDRLFDLGYFPYMSEFFGGHIHNGYLEELVNLGWLGASIIFFALLYLLFKGAFALIIPTVITSNYKFTCALFCVVIAGCVSSTFESWLTSVGSVFCFPFWFSAMLLVKMVIYFNDWSGVTERVKS